MGTEKSLRNAVPQRDRLEARLFLLHCNGLLVLSEGDALTTRGEWKSEWKCVGSLTPVERRVSV
eukprot:COSAG02_NODE_7128_length_3168_cov_3.176279_2_plen_64_part_00